MSELIKDTIAQVITELYMKAGVEQTSVKGIIPLFELIRAYPLAIVELENLTYQRAIEYIQVETGRPLQLPQHKNRDLAGFLFATEYRGKLFGYIFLNKNDLLPRRRFSAAHELGHYLLHFLPLLSQTVSAGENLVLVEGIAPANDNDEELTAGELTFATSSGHLSNQPVKSSEQLEREADVFAAELLMPASLCKQLVASITQRITAKNQVLEKRLMAELLVSQMAIKNRLRDLNLPQSVLGEPSAQVVQNN